MFSCSLEMKVNTGLSIISSYLANVYVYMYIIFMPVSYVNI